MRRHPALVGCLLAWSAIAPLPAQEAPAPRRLHELSGVIQAGFNHDASRVIARTVSGQVGLWDATTGVALAGDLGPGARAEGFVRSADARRVLIAQTSTSARVFDTTTAAALSPPLEIAWREDTQPCAIFSPDGATLLAIDDEGVTVWAVASGERRARLAVAVRGEDGQTGLTPAAIFTADGAQCWLLDRTGTATRYDTATWQPLGPPLRHPRAPSAYDFGLALSADGQWLATFDSPGENGPKAHLQVWNTATGKAVGKPLIAVNGLPGRFIPGEPRLLALPGRGEATIRDLPSLKITATLRAHDDVEGPSAQISPDGKWLISWGPDRTVRLLDASNGTLKDSQTFAAAISQVLMLPDSSGALLTFDNSAFFLLDHHDHYLARVEFPKVEIVHLHRFLRQLRYTALSPDGRKVLALVGETDRENILLLDAATLQVIAPAP